MIVMVPLISYYELYLPCGRGYLKKVMGECLPKGQLAVEPAANQRLVAKAVVKGGRGEDPPSPIGVGNTEFMNKLFQGNSRKKISGEGLTQNPKKHLFYNQGIYVNATQQLHVILQSCYFCSLLIFLFFLRLPPSPSTLGGFIPSLTCLFICCLFKFVAFLRFFSLVFSNCLPEQMRSRIGCICTPFLQSEFSNVFSHCCPNRCKVALVGFVRPFSRVSCHKSP